MVAFDIWYCLQRKKFRKLLTFINYKTFFNFLIATTELIANLHVKRDTNPLNIDFSSITPNYMVTLRERYKSLISLLAN